MNRKHLIYDTHDKIRTYRNGVQLFKFSNAVNKLLAVNYKNGKASISVHC